MRTTLLIVLTLIARSVFGITITSGGTAVPNQGLFTLVSNTITIDFNDGLLPSNANVIYDGLATNIITGSTASVSAAPPNDTSAYLTIGPSRGQKVTVRFAALVNYFGFFAGSLDTYNYVDLYLRTTRVSSLSGTQLATLGGFPADGNQGRGIYVNVFADTVAEQFDRIVLYSTSNAFETDNHSFRFVDTRPGAEASVPEPGSWMMAVLGVALVAIGRRAAR
jgi:hypothetical protein